MQEALCGSQTPTQSLHFYALRDLNAQVIIRITRTSGTDYLPRAYKSPVALINMASHASVDQLSLLH
jgi:hypothetical protein